VSFIQFRGFQIGGEEMGQRNDSYSFCCVCKTKLSKREMYFVDNGGPYCLKCAIEAENVENSVRKFESGATRDTDKEKLNYIKALCPLVLQRYLQYLNKHRLQSDGSLRDFDNWKKGINKQAYLESMARHLLAVWLLHENYSAHDNHGPVTIEDSLCGVIFNAMGFLHEILKMAKKK
jgi:hypothetical protein